MTTIQTIGLVIVGVIVSVFFSVSMNGGGDLGAVYDLTDRTVPSLTVVGQNANATTTMNLGKVCMKITESDGGTIYWYAKADGNIGTSTSGTCQQ